MLYMPPMRRHEKGSAYMTSKIRITAVIAVVLLVLILSSCGAKTPSDVLGSFISAVKECDTDGAMDCVTSPATIGGHVYTINDAKDSGDEYGIETLKKLYSFVKYTVISKNVELDEAGGETVVSDTGKQTVRIEISAPDFSALMSLIMSEAAYSAKPRIEVLADFIDDGTVGKYIKKMTLDVVLKKDEDRWTIPFSQSENRLLYEALGLSSFASWIL